MERVKIEDLYQYRSISNVRWSPDGARAAFVVSQGDQERNCYRYNIWLLDENGARRLTGMDEESVYYWEDENHIVFTANRTEKEKELAASGLGYTSYYRIDVRGGEATFAFRLPVKSGEIYRLPDGHCFTFGQLDLNHPDLHLCSEKERRELLDGSREENDYEVLERIPWWTNDEGHMHNLRSAVYLCDPEHGSAERLTGAEMTVTGATIYQGQFVFSSYDFSGSFRDEMMGLYIVAFEEDGTASVRCLMEPGQFVFEGMTAMPNGILVKGTPVSQNSGDFLLVDVETGTFRRLRTYPYSMGSTLGSDCRMGGGYILREYGGDLYFVATIGNGSALCVLQQSGEIKVLVPPEDGGLYFFDINQKGEILGMGLYGMQLPELYRLESGKPIRVTSVNSNTLDGKYVAQPEKLSFHSEGWDLDGWILKPMDYDPQKRYPAVLDIHGGPKTIYGEVFFHEMQVWAGLGYFVLFCNPIGSDGRGDEFTCGAYGEQGYKAFQNLMDFVDLATEKYPQIDTSRIAVAGGSYGGYMTNWVIGHTDRFACAATQRSIANELTMEALSDWGFVRDRRNCARNGGASLFQDAQKAWDLSPLKYAASFTTPTLIIHSDHDFRCPIAEGYQMFYALKKRNVDTRMVVFKGETHELSRSGKPKHRIRRLQEITDWFIKYTK